jgi:hypothetical protein
MLGRGGESTYHCGNIAFRQLVEDHKTKYYTCPRAHKSRVVAEVVQKWRQLSPPGRFLTRTHPGAGDKSPWHDVGDGRALKKASHSLRDSVRCFSLEKKQKTHEGDEAEAEISTSTSAAADNHRKRTRPELIPSSLGKKKPNVVVGRAIQLHTIATHKPKMLILPPALDERPVKRQRVVMTDEREDNDCRRSSPVEDHNNERSLDYFLGKQQQYHQWFLFRSQGTGSSTSLSLWQCRLVHPPRSSRQTFHGHASRQCFGAGSCRLSFSSSRRQ